VVRSLFPGNGILGAETTASKRSVTFNRSSAETNARTKTRQFGAICTTPGNLCLRKTAWWGWEDSNLQPNGYCRDTSEPGLASLIYRRSGRGSCTGCSVFLRVDRSFKAFRGFS
jgi:hypothetical protein